MLCVWALRAAASAALNLTVARSSSVESGTATAPAASAVAKTAKRQETFILRFVFFEANIDVNVLQWFEVARASLSRVKMGEKGIVELTSLNTRLSASI